MNEIEFEIDRGAVKYYLMAPPLFMGVILLPPLVLATCVSRELWLICFLFVCLILFLGFVPWFCWQQSQNFRYRLVGSTLRVDGGVLVLFRKAIPLERITDVALVQGPFMRFCDIWAMRIQTAGSSQCEATLIGVRDPERVRDLILSRRQSVYGEKSEDA